MKTAAARTPADIPMARWETGLIALLVVAGAAGFWIARGSIEERRGIAIKTATQRTQEIDRARTEKARLDRVALETDAVVIPDAGTQAAGQALKPLTPQAARDQAMALVTDLIGKGILRANPVVPGAPPAAGGGAVTPAYYVGPDGKLSPGFGELFKLDSGQVAHLQAVVTSLKQQAEEAVVAHTIVQQVSDNTYTLQMQPFGDEATQLRESFVSEFKSTLGDDGYKQFAALNGERVRDDGTTVGGAGSLLATVSGEGRTITIVRGPNGFQYTVQNPAGAVGGRGTVRDLTQVVSRLAPIDQLLPPTFTAPFAPPAGEAAKAGSPAAATPTPRGGF